MCDEMKNNEIRENEISESTANERPAAETVTGEEKSARGKNVFKRFGRGFVNFFKEKGADFKRNHKLKKEQRAKNRAAFKSLTGKQKTKTVCEWLLNHALYILIGIFVLVVFIYNNNFLSFDSIVNITMQSAARLIMALGNRRGDRTYGYRPFRGALRRALRLYLRFAAAIERRDE